MGNVTIFKNNSVTVSGPRESALKNVFNTGSFTSRRIQANINGTFRRIVNGEQVGNAVRGDLKVIIVNALPTPSRVFYAEKYDPSKEATLPNCWSNDGKVPEANASDRQAANCMICPQNIKGSGETGGRACRYQRRIAVLLEGDPSGDIYQLNIPAKSLFGKGTGNTHPFESYTRFVASTNEALDNIVTTVSFDTESSTMELVFSAERVITDDEYEMVKAARMKPEYNMVVRLTSAQTDKVEKLPAPQAQEEASEEEDAPHKRAKKKPLEVAPPKKDLKSSINDWE
jgi:hypothetical protein